MKIYNEWMTDNEYFGEDYPNNKLLDDAKYRFELQKQSLEGKDALVDGIEERIVAQNHTNPLNQEKYDKKLSFDVASNVHTGSLVEFDNIKWLVTSQVFDKQAYKLASANKSNNTLKLYNQNGILSEIPIVVESGVRLYSMGQDSTKYINTLSDEIIIYASATANIEVDDVYKIGKRNYKVMTVQDVLIDGLLVVKMEVTVEEVEEVEEPIEPPATGLFISPTDNFIYRNKTKVFTAKIFNNEVEDIVSRTIWLITNKDGTYNRYCEMTYDNRNCTLTASNESSHVGKVVILRLTLENDGSTYIEKEITIKSLV